MNPIWDVAWERLDEHQGLGKNSILSISQPPCCRRCNVWWRCCWRTNPECSPGMFGLLSEAGKEVWVQCWPKPQHRLVLVQLQRTKPTLVMGPSASVHLCFGSAGHTSATSPPLLWWLCACFPYESLPGKSDFSREIPGEAENGVFMVSLLPMMSDWNLWCLGSILAFPSTGQDGFHLSC